MTTGKPKPSAWPIVRTRKTRLERESPPPRRSQRPWAGYTPHDMKREGELDACPSARCRRAKLCLSALDNLYCLRTHHSLGEVKRRRRESPLQKSLDFVLPVVDPSDLNARLERVNELAAIRRAHEREMKEKWKRGDFDQLYGPYRAKGVILEAPPRAYVEGPKTGVDKPGSKM